MGLNLKVKEINKKERTYYSDNVKILALNFTISKLEKLKIIQQKAWKLKIMHEKEATWITIKTFYLAEISKICQSGESNAP